MINFKFEMPKKPHELLAEEWLIASRGTLSRQPWAIGETRVNNSILGVCAARYKVEDGIREVLEEFEPGYPIMPLYIPYSFIDENVMPLNVAANSPETENMLMAFAEVKDWGKEHGIDVDGGIGLTYDKKEMFDLRFTRRT